MTRERYQPRRDRREDLQAKAVYTVAELARAANLTRWEMLRDLESAGVPIRRRGRVFTVYWTDLFGASEALASSIREIERFQGLVEAVRASRDSREISTGS